MFKNEQHVLHTKPADSQSWLARRLTAQTLKGWKLNLVVHLINKPQAFLLTPHFKWSLLLLGTLWHRGVQLNFTLSFWIQWAISAVFYRPYCWHGCYQCWKKVPPQFGKSQKYPVLSPSSLFFSFCLPWAALTSIYVLFHSAMNWE